MRIVNNIKTFLYDKDYFINVYENNVHVYNYLDLLVLTATEIVLQLDNFNLQILGTELHVTRMAEKEIIVTGIINDMRFKR